MKIILDTNIIISTILNSKGSIGTFLLEDLQKHELFSCYQLYIEVFDKKEKIIAYSKLDEMEILDLLYIVFKRINFINEDQIDPLNWKIASSLVRLIDIHDLSFVALTLELDGTLWTGDKTLIRGLEKRGFKKAVDFESLKLLINKL